jgi:hypothetical protein
VPVTRISETDAADVDAGGPSLFADPNRYLMHKANAHAAGMPVCVQTVTLPYREEMCLKVMRTIESIMPMSDQ